jgi:hypothetical protein
MLNNKMIIITSAIKIKTSMAEYLLGKVRQKYLHEF